MSFLPIVDRELRVASRHWSTFLIRTGIGLLAMILCLPALFVGWVAGGGSGTGQGAFDVLSNYIFVVAMLGGLLITADCLSSEKREGTLGLLFLTDLRGHDVVLGKFAALGLHSMYGMLAVFPALALPLLFGGVTGREFWLVSLALLNLLFVSLSVGMAVSAASRRASRAFSATLILLLLIIAGLPFGVHLLGKAGAPPWVAQLAWVNPGCAFSAGQSTLLQSSPNEYWISLGLSHALAWAFLIAAGIIVPRSWQDLAQRGDQPTWARRLVGDRVARIFRPSRSPVSLDLNPMLWLIGERPVLKIILWSIAGIWCVAVVILCATTRIQEATGMVFGWSLVILFVFALALVEHSCRFWVDSRQNGSLETLLAVPLNSREILSSHWASIRRHFLWPLVIVLCTATLPTWITVGSEILTDNSPGSRLMESIVIYVYMGGMMLWFVGTFIAIGYTGMWFALKLRRPQFASGLTLLCAVLLPMMFCGLGFSMTLIFIFLPMSLLQSGLRGLILQRYVPAMRSSSKAGP